MKTRRTIRRTSLLLMLLPVAAVASPPSILVTTTTMRSAVQSVAGPSAVQRSLVSGGNCPGHYDLRSGDVAALRSGAVLFCHGFEPFVPRLADASGRKTDGIVRISVAGNWLLPPVYVRALESVCQHLCRLDPAGAALYRRNTQQATARCRQVSTEARGAIRRTGRMGGPVLCSEQQATFAEWLGFRVVGTFPRSEDLTTRRYQELCRSAKQAKILLVVENLQSAGAGAALASATGVPCVTLSNFPDGYPNTPSWEACVRHNVARLTRALKQAGRSDASAG